MKAARLRFCQEHKDWDLEDRKTLFGQMKLLFALVTSKEVFGYGGLRLISTIQLLFVLASTRHRNLCFGNASLIIRRGLAIFGSQKQLQKEESPGTNQEDERQDRASNEGRVELNHCMERLTIPQNRGGPKPKWKFNAENGAFVRNKGKGGIDW